MEVTKTSKKKSIVFFLLFTLCFFLFRISDFSRPLSGEEGIHANIFYNAPQNPTYLLIGRINGADLLIIPEHPALLYETIKNIGFLWKIIFQIEDLNTTDLSCLVRFAFSMIQFIVFVGFLLVVLFTNKISKNSRLITSLVIFFVAMSVPVIKMSTSVQVDGSVGFLFSGILAIVILIFSMHLLPDIISYSLLIISSTLFGFGKNEWSIALLFSILISLLFLLIYKRSTSIINNKKRYLFFLGILTLGLVIGNLISYFYDSTNYLSGFFVMTRISKASTFFDLRGIYHKLPYAYTNIFISFILIVAIYRSRKDLNFFHIFSTILFFTLFLAYFFISWVPDARYFAPSISIGITAIILSSDLIFWKSDQKKVVGIFCIFLLMSAINSISQRGYIEQIVFNTSEETSLENNQPNCLEFIDAGQVFNNEIDFISNSMDRVAAENIAAQNNQTLCP